MTNKLPKKSSGDESSTKAVAVPDKKELRKYTPDEVKATVLEHSSADGDVTYVLKKLSDGLLAKYRHGTPQEQSEVEEEVKKQASAVMYGFEADTHVTLMESFGERFRGGAKEVCKQFIHDFDCKTNSEKLMAETAAIAFMRYLDASRRLNNCLDVNNSLSHIKTGYMAMLSKERDRAHRQYLSTVATIKQLKAPAIEMNINAKTAFVSQNQQINAPQQSNETNESK